MMKRLFLVALAGSIALAACGDRVAGPGTWTPPASGPVTEPTPEPEFVCPPRMPAKKCEDLKKIHDGNHDTPPPITS
jgi:hypothetical protein